MTPNPQDNLQSRISHDLWRDMRDRWAVGKPMAVEERRGASVGWDGNGQVMWNQRPGGETVDEAGLEAMKTEAARVQQMAQEKVDAARKK